MAKFVQGIYEVKNKEKYVGDVRRVIFRSSWERFVFHHLDTNPSVLKWCSEETVIPYRHPITGTAHRYFVDITMQVRTKDGTIKNFLVEIKPYKQTQVPKKPKRLTESYRSSVETFLVNQAKWEAARKYAKERGFRFVIFTERGQLED